MSLSASQRPFLELAAEIIAPPPDRWPDEWANENRMLPPGSAEKGRIRTGRTPYAIPIARTLTFWYVRLAIFVMARQMAKTHGVIFNYAGWKLADHPEPIVYVGPTRDNIDDVIEPKFDDMLRKADSLWRVTVKGQRYKKHMKLVNGVPVRFAWAGSDTMLKADSAGVVFIDEIDGIEQARPTAGEGTVKDMADAMVSSYLNGRVAATSTPTHGHVETTKDDDSGMEHWAVADEVISAVWRYWQEGTRHEWAWPCPHCRWYFIPRSKHIQPRPDQHLTPDEFEAQGHVQCPTCGEKIHTHHRPWMNARGVMIQPGMQPMRYEPEFGSMTETAGADGPGPLVIDHREKDEALRAPRHIPWGSAAIRGRPSNVSFWVSGLATFSRRTTYGMMARRLHEALRSGMPQRQQGVYNTLFGETFQAMGEVPPWSELLSMAKASDYVLGTVPASVTTLRAGADVSENEIQWAVWGFVPNSDMECFLIDRGVISGPTDEDATWVAFGKRVLDVEWANMKVSVMGIDAGYRPEKVYAFVKEHIDRCVATIGEDTMDSFWKLASPETSSSGKTRRYGIKLWHLNTDITKSWVHSRVKRSVAGDVVWHLPRDIDDEFCKQITAESRIVDHRGNPKWVKHRPNHQLDAAAIAWFAAHQAAIPDERPIAAGSVAKHSSQASGNRRSQMTVADSPWLQ